MDVFEEQKSQLSYLRLIGAPPVSELMGHYELSKQNELVVGKHHRPVRQNRLFSDSTVGWEGSSLEDDSDTDLLFYGITSSPTSSITSSAASSITWNNPRSTSCNVRSIHHSLSVDTPSHVNGDVMRGHHANGTTNCPGEPANNKSSHSGFRRGE